MRYSVFRQKRKSNRINKYKQIADKFKDVSRNRKSSIRLNMPILKQTDVTPRRPVIVMIYGQPGAGKTSVATTANAPLIIDTDKGFDRSVRRVDTLIATKWEDVLAEQNQGSFSQYKTIILDTVRGCTDDYLQVYVVEQDYKLQRNTLKRYGAMGEQFKRFVSYLRSIGCDIIFIAHDKETQEGDIIKHAPDCTGQTKDLLVRIADEVGYIFMENGQRKIQFNPDETHVGKNVAGLPVTVIPEATDPEFGTFMAKVLETVKDGIQNKSESNRKAQEQLATLREQLAEAETEEAVEELMQAAKDLPDILKAPFFGEMKEALSAKGFAFDAKKKTFVKPQDDEPAEAHD